MCGPPPSRSGCARPSPVPRPLNRLHRAGRRWRRAEGVHPERREGRPRPARRRAARRLAGHVVVDTEHVGAVLTDLGSRRAQIQGTDAEDDDGLRTRVSALVPQLELVDYPIALRSVARGTGELHRSPHGYQPMPERLAAEHAAG